MLIDIKNKLPQLKGKKMIENNLFQPI